MRGKWLFAFQKLASNYNSHFQWISRLLPYLGKQKQESVLFLASFTYLYVNVQALDLEIFPKHPPKSFPSSWFGVRDVSLAVGQNPM